MGANVSNQQTDILNKTTQRIINEQLTAVQSTTDTTVYSRQNINVDYSGANLTNCPLTISQNANVTASLLANNVSDLSNTIDTKLKAAVLNQVKQATEQVNTGLNFGQANVSNNVARTKNIMDQQLTNIIRNSITNVVSSQIGGEQTITVFARSLTCNNSPIEINQATIVDALSKNISESVIKNIATSDVGIDLKTKLDLKTAQKNEGLNFNFLMIIIAIVVLGGGAFAINKVTKGMNGKDGEGGSVVNRKNIAILSIGALGASGAWYFYERQKNSDPTL